MHFYMINQQKTGVCFWAGWQDGYESFYVFIISEGIKVRSCAETNWNKTCEIFLKKGFS